MLSCRRDRTSHWWADTYAELSGIPGSNVEVFGNEILAKLPGCLGYLLCCLSPTLAFSGPWISLWLGWNSHSVPSFQASHHPAHHFLFLDYPSFLWEISFQPEQGSWIETFSYVLPFKKVNHYFPFHSWELNLGECTWSSLEFSLVSQPVAFPSSSSKAWKLSFHFHYCVSGTSPNVISSNLWRWHQGTWFIERNKSTLTQYFPGIIFILPRES